MNKPLLESPIPRGNRLLGFLFQRLSSDSDTIHFRQYLSCEPPGELLSVSCIQPEPAANEWEARARTSIGELDIRLKRESKRLWKSFLDGGSTWRGEIRLNNRITGELLLSPAQGGTKPLLQVLDKQGFPTITVSLAIPASKPAVIGTNRSGRAWINYGQRTRLPRRISIAKNFREKWRNFVCEENYFRPVAAITELIHLDELPFEEERSYYHATLLFWDFWILRRYALFTTRGS
jgi:hypothetical protein